MLILNQSVGARGALRLRADYIRREKEFIVGVMRYEDSFYMNKTNIFVQFALFISIITQKRESDTVR